MQIAHVELGGEVCVVVLDPLEHVLGVADQVHLVDGYDDVLDPQQRHDEAVPARLLQHAVARVDQDHRQIAGAGASGHVPGVLLMARGVGDDELRCSWRSIGRPRLW